MVAQGSDITSRRGPTGGPLTSGNTARTALRFTGPEDRLDGSTARGGSPRDLLGGALVRGRLQGCDVGQVPEPLRVVQPVPDDELRRDLEPHVLQVHVD